MVTRALQRAAGARQLRLGRDTMAKTHVTMTVNGAEVEGLVEPRTLLIHFLRENLNLTGTHIGCDTTHCGACTVDLDGKSVKSCTMFAVQADGAEITTIEGMANADGTLHALQEGFRMMHGLQCGFCTPGMIMRAYRLLQENPIPTEEEIRFGISGNLCRCTGYQNIVKAIQYAAAKINGVAIPGGRRMNDMTPTREQREAKLEGMGCKRKRVEDIRFTQGKGNYVDDLKLPGMLLRRLRPLAACPRAHQDDRHTEGAEGAGRAGGAHRRDAEDASTSPGCRRSPATCRWCWPTARCCSRTRKSPSSSPSDRYAAADGVELVEVEYEALPVHRRSVQGDGARCAGAARGPHGQDRRARTARASTTTTSSSGRSATRTCTDAAFAQGRRDDQGDDLLSARASLAARDLPVRRLVRQDQGRADGLGHLPGAARHPHGGLADLQDSRAQDPRDLARHRRRLRQQGRRLSRLHLRHRRLDRDRPAGEVGRGPHREPDRRPRSRATTT